jgi:hypothetical protein
MNQQNQPNWLDVERARAAAGKTYVNASIVVMILYLFFWLPGIVANFAYIYQASTTQQLIGRPPEGSGCLWMVLVAFNVPLIIAALLFAFFSLGILRQ